MSDFVPKPGSFTLFKNDYREKETQPEYKGTGADLDGKPMDIAAWVKESKTGKKFFSIKISEPFQKSEEPAKNPGLAREEDDPFPADDLDGDQIPF